TYPGSFLDFLDMIDPLVDPVAHGGRPEDAFHLVIPSMPGFGFSTPVVGDTDWTMARVARAYDVLLRDLGYDSYGIHGSDGGAMVGRELAVLD
ncbi:epoxide hydrolase, partial [Bacillus velezensis]|uniref:alpha/beta fold hydrolase n=1 Tax=Bacillus velezensis TaxID=492670 RepID=UPI003977B1AB